MSDVTCRVCGEEIGRMGLPKHSGMHRREFKERFGRPPEDYDEVVESLGGDPPGDAATLSDFGGAQHGE